MRGALWNPMSDSRVNFRLSGVRDQLLRSGRRTVSERTVCLTGKLTIWRNGRLLLTGQPIPAVLTELIAGLPEHRDSTV